MYQVANITKYLRNHLGAIVRANPAEAPRPTPTLLVEALTFSDSLVYTPKIDDNLRSRYRSPVNHASRPLTNIPSFESTKLHKVRNTPFSLICDVFGFLES